MKKIMTIIILLILVITPKVYAQDKVDSTVFESRIINISFNYNRRIMHVKEVIQVENVNINTKYKFELREIGANTNLKDYDGSSFSLYEDGEYYISYEKKCSNDECNFNYLNIYNGETPIRFNNMEINIIKEKGYLYISDYFNDFSSFSKREKDGNIYLTLLPEKDGYLETFKLQMTIRNPIENIVDHGVVYLMLVFLLIDILIYFLLYRPLRRDPFIISKEKEDKYKMRVVKYATAGTIFLVGYWMFFVIVGGLLESFASVAAYNILTDIMSAFIFIGFEFIWFLYLVNSYRLYKKLLAEK